jgi:hypothetical protein
MKKSCAALAFCLVAACQSSAFKPEDGFGIGFVLGTPSGISVSLPIGNTNAINGVLGYDIGNEANLHLQGDYVWILEGLIPVESGKISIYYGPGAFAVLAKTPAAGIRAVAGIDYRFQEIPLQAFLEIGPGINIVPNTVGVLGAGLGLRYYF